jgi:hypothetical protein
MAALTAVVGAIALAPKRLGREAATDLIDWLPEPAIVNLVTG